MINCQKHGYLTCKAVTFLGQMVRPQGIAIAALVPSFLRTEQAQALATEGRGTHWCESIPVGLWLLKNPWNVVGNPQSHTRV